MRVRLLLMVSLAAVSLATPLAQGTPPSASDNDLDAFMSRVLARRDENWKKLQQYVLEERETLHIVGPGATPLYGSGASRRGSHAMAGSSRARCASTA